MVLKSKKGQQQQEKMKVKGKYDNNNGSYASNIQSLSSALDDLQLIKKKNDTFLIELEKPYKRSFYTALVHVGLYSTDKLASKQLEAQEYALAQVQSYAKTAERNKEKIITKKRECVEELSVKYGDRDRIDEVVAELAGESGKLRADLESMNQSDNYHSECKDELIKLVMDFETADDQLGNIKQAIDLQEKEKDSLDDEYNKICDYLDTVRIQQITLSKKVGDLRTFVKQDKSGGIEDFINLMQTTLVQGEQSRIMGEHYSETEQETRELTNKILGVEESTYKSPPVFDDVRKDVKRKREERLQKSLQRIEARKNNTTPKSQQSPVRVVDKNDA